MRASNEPSCTRTDRNMQHAAFGPFFFFAEALASKHSVLHSCDLRLKNPLLPFLPTLITPPQPDRASTSNPRAKDEEEEERGKSIGFANDRWRRAIIFGSAANENHIWEMHSRGRRNSNLEIACDDVFPAGTNHATK